MYLKSQFSNLSFVEKFSVRSGLEALKKNEFDLLLLDMTLPTFDITPTEEGGLPQPYGGRELLLQLKRFSKPTPAIVISGFDRFGEGHSGMSLEELNQQLAKDNNKSYKGAIYYSTFDDNWMQNLNSLIKSIKGN
ncbi:response regulator [Solidesulfovibrio sp.]